ncbi:phage head completion protein [Novosphingobium clariflavum]|uniref:Head-tail adaptor protein n=1 Tax=Novosphingobium clariflavum TaxID=2029884 RepID=A0ABV6S5X3_9SPHN|nr:head-tail adaptor protein [Novosphingobium clariflavum]
MPGAGKRDKLVKLQRYTATEDDYGEDNPATWPEFGQEWARIIWGRGSERREAAQMQAQQAATIQVLDNSNTRSLRAKDRFAWNGMNFDIAASGVPVNRGELEFVVTAPVS